MHLKAGISPEAQAVVNEALAALELPEENLSIEELRQKTLEEYRPQIEKALLRYPVSTSDIEAAGVRCMKVVPENANADRQILYFFGGGFIQGSPFEDLPITAALACKTGATIVVPYYRLAPEHPFPAALDDVTEVAKVLLSETEGTLLAGESAGGNLTLAVTHRLRAEGHPVPKAIAALSPAADLFHQGDSQNADRDPFLRAARVPDVQKAYCGNGDLTSPEISPINGTFDPGFPPTFMTSGTRDLLLSGCVRLARVMRESGATVDLRIWEGMWHVFEFGSVYKSYAWICDRGGEASAG